MIDSHLVETGNAATDHRMNSRPDDTNGVGIPRGGGKQRWSTACFLMVLMTQGSHFAQAKVQEADSTYTHIHTHTQHTRTHA